MALLFADENFPRPVVHELRRLGANVLTAAEAGLASQSIPDEEVLAFASSQGRAVLTINRKHFVRLHSTHPEHAGILVCTLDLDFTGQAARIQTLIQPLESLQGKLLRVNHPV